MADGGRLLREGLVALLGASEGPLTAPYLAYELGGGSFGQVCEELDSLCSDGVVRLGSSGYELRSVPATGSREHPAPHDRTSSSEVGACDPAHSGSERMGGASPRSDDDARRPHAGESGAEERFPVLFHGTSADALGLKGVAA